MEGVSKRQTREVACLLISQTWVKKAHLDSEGKKRNFAKKWRINDVIRQVDWLISLRLTPE